MKMFCPLNQSFDDALQNLQQASLNTPFDEDVLNFTQSLSKRFIRMRHLPEVVALGYWLRKANIKQMQAQFEQQTAQKIVHARGIVFHIAPSNVDTIFVYSWMLSLLAGNKNIIRLSSKSEVNGVLQVILEELPAFPKVAAQTIICTYSHDEQATEVLSSICHTRVVWGGDATVNTVRQVSLAPLANELVFPNRFSLAVLNAAEVSALTEAKLDSLLDKFYNDVFWFDQMACSSPRLIVWVGEPPVHFWPAFEQKVQVKQYELLAATQVMKYTTTLQLATEAEVKRVLPKTYFSRVQLENVTKQVREQHCGGGLFYEYEVSKLSEVANVIIDKDQTISYFGFEKEELVTFIEHITARGIDRIVPIGQALDFSGVWDGQSFLTSFTREIQIII